MIEDYVSFETAKLLKDKGFYQDYFSDITPVWALNGKKPELAFNGDAEFPFQWQEWYSAPTLAVAMKWLREVHNISIEPLVDFGNGDEYWWAVDVAYIKKNGLIDELSGYNSYEESCDAAISIVLKI